MPDHRRQPETMYGSRHHDTGAVGTAPLPAGDGRGADQKRRPLRMVPRKGHRGRGQRHRPARNGTQRTPRLQTRTRGEGHHGGDETVAQGLPPGAAPLTPFREAAAQPFEGRKFIAHCAPALSPAGKAYLPATLRKGEAALVFIGPEGDFSAEEIAFACANGFEEITLGTQRLRTETAAVVATVMASVANAGQ